MLKRFLAWLGFASAAELQELWNYLRSEASRADRNAADGIRLVETYRRDQYRDSNYMHQNLQEHARSVDSRVKQLQKRIDELTRDNIAFAERLVEVCGYMRLVVGNVESARPNRCTPDCEFCAAGVCITQAIPAEVQP